MQIMLPLSLLLPLSLPLIFLLLLLRNPYRHRLPPGPRPWPLIGNLSHIKPVRFRCYAEWAQCYGPIISVRTGSILNVVVSNAELAKQVLKEKDQQLANRHRNRSAARFSKDGEDLIWADYGPHYVKVRKVCTTELFSPKRVEALRYIREDEVSAMVESIYRDCSATDKLGKSVVVRKYVGSVAFNNITRLTFGKRFEDAQGTISHQGLEFKAIVANGIKLGASLSIAEHIPWLRWLDPLDEAAFAKHGARRDRLTREIMDEHARARLQNAGSGDTQHFLDALLTLKEKYDLSEKTIIGLLWDMITAGMDTTTISVEWGLAELMKNPRVQLKAQEELDRVIGQGRVVTELDITTLPYLRCVAKESLRLHPPTPLMLPHRANADVNIGGYDIPASSNVIVNVWAIARDLEVWNNPLDFYPERFLDDDVDIKGADFRLLPFGAGRRMCPGAQLGINLVTSMIARLLHHFHWGMSPCQEIDMGESPGIVTYMRTPLKAIPTPRLPPNLYKRVPLDA